MNDDNIVYPASCVASPDGHGVLISGPSGAGKSSLCLLLMDRGFKLVSDDQTQLQIRHNRLEAIPAPNIAGLIEIRNLGIVESPACATDIPIALYIRLDPDAPRFIEQPYQKTLLGHDVPSIAIWPDMATAPIKVEYALRLHGKRD
ncbi:HPr kinase/phosphorylase [Alterisphingorhabdus coralli]|uniref:HPr kinase/phosphatase C-terminal domain-containing protein n=1 Tax=Alterisphingorhabdus coralli TaxID=3071408 RepID=A0AA97F636_9SPHN|nr:HPr kinase/phosphatase C-terminal domain-containing protein [Parasphingorhabdus sp. SCSIO 66989]WOE73797.1 HPr kinase/phosphatase C-terminal domain-containing protein [Parasphingorhabdus sp. SCSIO 66989]